MWPLGRGPWPTETYHTGCTPHPELPGPYAPAHAGSRALLLTHLAPQALSPSLWPLSIPVVTLIGSLARMGVPQAAFLSCMLGFKEGPQEGPTTKVPIRHGHLASAGLGYRSGCPCNTIVDTSWGGGGPTKRQARRPL